jgi:heme/copper-type cytochrome/quinol oxidase subunit 3
MAAESSPAPAVGLSREQEEAAFYHEAALNTTWTGVRLMIGMVASGLGAFIFAFFYLRSLNSHGLWYPSGPVPTKPFIGTGTIIMALIVLSAVAATLGLQRIKAGKRDDWIRAAAVAVALGVAAAAVQIWQLTDLGFQPGASGFASVFVGASPVLALLALATMTWLEILIMQARRIPEISFVEQPVTFAEAATVQRLQAALSACTLFWNFIAVVAVVLWILFYLVH